MAEVSLEKVEAVSSPIIQNLGYRLVDVELASEQGRVVLRLFIDKDGGSVTIGDCTLVSHAVEDAIDAEGALTMRYVLEVSSPGLDRPLKTENDFQRYSGREIRLKTREPVEGRMNYRGLLEKFENGKVHMTVDNMKFEIPFGQIAKARLVPDIQKGKKRN